MITLVIPVYNVEAYLLDCLESVRKQRFQDFEAILIDDGSTDGSGAICNQYAKRDSRFRAIHQENKGLSDARNSGIEQAAGEYISFLDSDDFIGDQYLSYLYGLITEAQADISVCGFAEVDAAGNRVKSSETLKPSARLYQGAESGLRALLKEKSITTAAWGKLYRTELFREVRFPSGRYHEDIFTIYKPIVRSGRIAAGNQAQYFYRQRGESITHQRFSRKHFDEIRGNIERAAFVREHYPSLRPYADAEILWASNRCFMRMVAAECRDEESICYLQSVYRKNIRIFLMGSSRIPAKLFAALAWMNLRVLLSVGIRFQKIMQRLLCILRR